MQDSNIIYLDSRVGVRIFCLKVDPERTDEKKRFQTCSPKSNMVSYKQAKFFIQSLFLYMYLVCIRFSFVSPLLIYRYWLINMYFQFHVYAECFYMERLNLLLWIMITFLPMNKYYNHSFFGYTLMYKPNIHDIQHVYEFCCSQCLFFSSWEYIGLYFGISCNSYPSSSHLK